MSDKTKIAWCDSTVNFWSGCTKVLPGCANCYAAVRDARQMQEKKSHWGKGARRLKHVGAVKQALAMNCRPMICDHCGEADTVDNRMSHITSCPNRDCPSNLHEHVESSFHSRRIFSLSLGDWLDAEVPIEWLAEMLDTIRQCDQMTWILCTKRPENWIPLLKKVALLPQWPLCEWVGAWLQGTAPKYIILLASVESQAMADMRIPQLLAIPAKCHGLSLEPLLGPVLLKKSLISYHIELLNWLIIGGESGIRARPFDMDAGASLIRQGKAAGVPVFFKQMGSNVMQLPGLYGKKGDDPSEWPPEFNVQQWPKGF